VLVFVTLFKEIKVIYLPRVAEEIRTIGLYDLVLQDVQKIAGKSKVTQDEVLEIIDKNPQILKDYKQINTEYNISNIHIRNIDLSNLKDKCRSKAEEINKKLNFLREIEENIPSILSRVRRWLSSSQLNFLYSSPYSIL